MGIGISRWLSCQRLAAVIDQPAGRRVIQIEFGGVVVDPPVL
jgi:hypothetical protein